MIVDGIVVSPGGPSALTDLVARSDYLFVGRVAATPSKSTHYETGLQDWTVRLEIKEVVARRPATPELGVGKTVKVVAETLDGREHPNIDYAGAVAVMSSDELPNEGDIVVAFAASDPTISEGSLRLWGHAVIPNSGGPLTMHGFGLRGYPAVQREAVTTALVPEFASPKK